MVDLDRRTVLKALGFRPFRPDVPNHGQTFLPGQPSGELMPFRPDVPNHGQTFLPDPPHGWNDTYAAWNLGRHDQWVPNKRVTTMTHHTRVDLRSSTRSPTRSRSATTTTGGCSGRPTRTGAGSR